MHDKIVHADVSLEGLLYLIFAHNFCEVWDLTDMTLKQRTLCEEECILYSADFHMEQLLIIGGTVFRSVLIWSLKD